MKSRKMKMISKEQFCRELGVSTISWLFAMSIGDKHVFWKAENGTLYYQGFKPNGVEKFCNRFKKKMFKDEWLISIRTGMEPWGKWQSWTYRA